MSGSRLKRHARGGFSLVEVLTALVVMSVGMLGIAGLYVQSLQAGRTSMFSQHAVTLAGDVADRIRANPRAGEAYAAEKGVDNHCVAANKNCNAAEMAATDIFLWHQQAADTLPGGTVSIVYDAAVSPPTYVITVSWSEPGAQPAYSLTIPVLSF